MLIVASRFVSIGSTTGCGPQLSGSKSHPTQIRHSLGFVWRLHRWRVKTELPTISLVSMSHAIASSSERMASLERDPISKTYLVRFRYGGREFKRALGTTNAKLANAMEGRIEETLLLLRNGRLRIPAGCDPVLFILSDGKVLEMEPELVTLDELFNRFKACRIPGVKDAATIKTEDPHLRHLQRILKGRTFVQSITAVQMQEYVATRLGEVRKGGRTVAAETVRKETATFRVVWNWGVKQQIVQGAAPIADLEYPKRNEKPPFMTWAEIERTISPRLDARAARSKSGSTRRATTPLPSRRRNP